MLKTIVSATRFVVGLAVIGTFAGSVILMVLGALTVFRIAWQEIKGFDPEALTGHHVDRLGVDFIQVTDIILLGTVLYLVSIGLYQLFIDHNPPKLPRWLRVDDLTDLKRDLIGVTVVLLAVTFLGEVVDWDGSGQILQLGIAVALVVAALGLIMWLTPKELHEEDISEA